MIKLILINHSLVVEKSWCGSWIYYYLCNQCPSPVTFRVIIPLRRGVLDTTLCDKVCQSLATGRSFSPCTLVKSNTTFVFGIDRCSAYTGKINKDILHWDLLKVRFIQDFGLFSVRFKTGLTVINNEYIYKQRPIKTSYRYMWLLQRNMIVHHLSYIKTVVSKVFSLISIFL